MDKKKGIGLCICKMCPSYVKCDEEIAYCLAISGKSTCIAVEQGCLCPSCPVLEQEGFQHVFYCTRGSETGQRSAK
jgi:hypothetical protein